MKRIHIREARLRAGLTQEELAKRLGKRQAEISKLERGRLPEPRLSEGQAIGKALGLDPFSIAYGPIA